MFFESTVPRNTIPVVHDPNAHLEVGTTKMVEWFE